jgi:hypothetical protein
MLCLEMEVDKELRTGHGGFDPDGSGPAGSEFHVYPIVYSIRSGYRPSFTRCYYLGMGDFPSLWVSSLLPPTPTKWACPRSWRAHTGGELGSAAACRKQ